MRPWFLMLAGLSIWAIHFGGGYAITSLADFSWPDDRGWRLAGGAFSLACLIICLGLVGASIRAVLDLPEETSRFMVQIGAVGAGLAFVAVAWQSIAILV